ncbi:1-aminocyclopropane-1-carboxylate oxidase homolog [Durio zibethinus]|uniref:1-aminocyclopropane-1-carboxylate oxidase homolog n=1 Tax=Durio zibethinus TaxID=66656 RepID=A0A6P6A7X1_DURZI|nr:1-aminocyclopropane-1-carboxylate oxidase homolog [Durio zibethinus]
MAASNVYAKCHKPSPREQQTSQFRDQKKDNIFRIRPTIAGVWIPEFQSANELAEDLDHTRTHIRLPVIDLDGLLNDHHRKIERGFFQVVNHGLPPSVLNNIIDGVRKFSERDLDEKKEFYSRDRARRVRFNRNYDLFQSNRADWRDTLSVSMPTSDHVEPNELPTSCR